MNKCILKKQFGQFFTTNSDYILPEFGKYIKGKEVVDPFAGKRRFYRVGEEKRD